MKKYLILSIIGLFMLTGCGAGKTKTMSCSYNTTTQALDTKMTYKIDYVGKEVKKLRITYDYHQDVVNNDNQTNETDGVDTGTDGTTNDTIPDNDGIVDGIVGSAIDTVINGVSDTILDISGIRDRHSNVQNTYGNINGFSIQNTNDITDNNYRVTYIIDYDNITDENLATLNLSRDIDTLKSNYTAQGFTCDE